MPSTNGHGPKRAILYARVSTDEQARSGYSLAQQLEALREYAAREGYEAAAQRGISTTPSSTNLPSSSGRRRRREAAEGSFGKPGRRRSSAVTRPATVFATTRRGTATRWSRTTWPWSGGSSL
jgi:Resolvase, N terminal domain